MSKSLFDHIKGVTYRKTKWEDLSEEDIKSWSNYMITRFFSMEIELVELMNDVQKYTNGILSSRDYYKLLYDMLPKHSFFLKYVKSKHRVEIEPEILKIFCNHFKLGKSEVYGYINYLKQNNSQELTDILKMYGVKESDIELFQKKLKK
jgi:hypothetical protein